MLRIKILVYFISIFLCGSIYAAEGIFGIYQNAGIVTTEQSNTPNSNITRKEFSHMLVLALEQRLSITLPAAIEGDTGYSDIANIQNKNGITGDIFKSSILKLFEFGIFTKNPQFRPEDNISRYEVLALILRTGKKLKLVIPPMSLAPYFIDLPIQKATQYDEMQLGFHHKFVSGYAYIKGQRNSHYLCKDATVNYSEDQVFTNKNIEGKDVVRCFRPNLEVNFIEATNFIEKLIIRVVVYNGTMSISKPWYTLFNISDETKVVSLLISIPTEVNQLGDSFSIPMLIKGNYKTKEILVDAKFKKNKSITDSKYIGKDVYEFKQDVTNLVNENIQTEGWKLAIFELDRDLVNNNVLYENYNHDNPTTEKLLKRDSFAQELKRGLLDGDITNQNKTKSYVEYVSVASADGNKAKLIPPATPDYFKAGGYEIFTFSIFNTNKQQNIFIKNQADWLIYTGHGSSCSGAISLRHSDGKRYKLNQDGRQVKNSLLPNDADANLREHWNSNLKGVFLFGCSVLDIGDCNNRYNEDYYRDLGATCTQPDRPNPGLKWRDELKATNLTILGFSGAGPLIAKNNGWILIKYWIKSFIDQQKGSFNAIEVWRDATEAINPNDQSSHFSVSKIPTYNSVSKYENLENGIIQGENLSRISPYMKNASAFDLKEGKYWHWSTLSDHTRKWESTNIYDKNFESGTCSFTSALKLENQHLICMNNETAILGRRDFNIDSSRLCATLPFSKQIEPSNNLVVKVNNQLVNSSLNEKVLSCDIQPYSNNSWKPIFLEINDSNGEKIYTGYYPFKDVKPSMWYSNPILKLWEKRVIQGYNDGSTGIFGTYNPTTRAEFIAAVVRAIEGSDYTALTADPFTDVSKDDWYAPYIQYAKDIGLIQGCDQDKNLFCPNAAITRAEAMKVLILAYPQLKKLAEDYAQGKAPKKIYPDVNDTEQWYYSYIYAAQAANIAHGYRDGTFEPNSELKRAEMAKVICIAEFGLMQCIDMGDSANKSLILTASPYKAEINQMTTFSLYGINLPENMTLAIQDCANISQIAGTKEKRNYQCTPTSAGSKQGTVTSATGEQLYTFTVQVEDIVDPVTLPGDGTVDPEPNTCTDSVVSNVTPTTATLNQLTTFTIYGECLSAQTAFFIDECVDVKNVGGNEQQQQFTCTPSYQTGSHNGLVKDRSGGTELYSFNVNYLGSDEPTDPVDPPPSACTDISVSSVTPTTATLGQLTTFTANGSCLSEQTAFYIDECIGVKSIGGNEQQRQFTCTPGYKTGSHSGLVKDRSGGTELHNFNVNFEWGTPKVTQVTPTTVQLNQVTDFMIEGSSLLDTTAIWIDGCEGLTVFNGDANNLGFQCKPTKSGTVSAVVKDKSGGNVLFDFTVTVQ